MPFLLVYVAIFCITMLLSTFLLYNTRGENYCKVLVEQLYSFFDIKKIFSRILYHKYQISFIIIDILYLKDDSRVLIRQYVFFTKQ